jgi:hypothetical protein
MLIWRNSSLAMFLLHAFLFICAWCVQSNSIQNKEGESTVYINAVPVDFDFTAIQPTLSPDILKVRILFGCILFFSASGIIFYSGISRGQTGRFNFGFIPTPIFLTYRVLRI